MKTFIIRLWVASGDEGNDDEPLRGLLEPLGSAEATPFRGADQLLDLLRAGLAATPDARAAREKGKGER